MTKKQISIRVREDLLEKIRSIAAEEGRTLSGQIVKWVQDKVREAERV